MGSMILEQHPEIQRLSPSEKFVLVTELWDDLAAHPADVPVSPEQIAELDRRMEAYRKDPTKVTTWEAIKERILGSAA
jgi:putative addiction module component (TIGR02574 family)